MNLLKYVGDLPAVEAAGITFKRGIPTVVDNAAVYQELSRKRSFAVSSLAELETFTVGADGELIAPAAAPVTEPTVPSEEN